MLIGFWDIDDRIVVVIFFVLVVMVFILGLDIVVGGDKRKYFIEGRFKVLI